MFYGLDLRYRGFVMLSVKEQKDIVDLVKKYKRARLRLADHYNSRSANQMKTMCLKRAEKYFDTMNRMIANNPDTLTNTDIQCFALLIDGFEQMRRNRLLGELQKYASFDVQAYVGAYNRNGFFKNAKNVTEMSPEDLRKRQTKYISARAKVKKNPTNTHSVETLDIIRDEVVELSRAVVNKTVKLTPEYASAALGLLETVGIIDDKKTQAINILNDWLKNNTKVNENVKPKKSWFGKLKDKFQSWRDKIKSGHEEKKSKEPKNIIKNKAEMRAEKRDARRANFEQAASVLKKTVSGVVDNIEYDIKSGVETINAKHAERKAVRDEKKHNRQIIRDAEKTSREHWKNLKKAEKKQEPKQHVKQTKKHRFFMSGLVSVLAAGALFAGLLKIGVDAERNYKDAKIVKKEVKAKPVVQKQEAATVAIDTAYAQALMNYYNSALDIIGGNKKADVLSKINNQVQSGNIVLSDYISAERVAYAYFMYREYGIKVDVLDLAVNSNQKLTDAQNAELIKVVLDAGERGAGVKKMAQQRVESRGGSLGKYSKFEHATRAQQRAYLVSRGVLKKVQHNR
jgi:hypothetical protein